MIWDDLDLYYGHKAQELIFTDVSDTIHADSLALLALNIEILLADVTKPEKSTILTLTWPVTSSVTSGLNFWPFTGSSRTGLSNGVWNLEIGPVVWEISGGPLPPPPPSRTCHQTPAGRGLKMTNINNFCFRWRQIHGRECMTWFLSIAAAIHKSQKNKPRDGFRTQSGGCGSNKNFIGRYCYSTLASA